MHIKKEILVSGIFGALVSQLLNYTLNLIAEGMDFISASIGFLLIAILMADVLVRISGKIRL